MIRRWVLYGILPFVLSGCVSAQESGYVSNYQAMEKGQYLEKVWINKDLLGRKVLKDVHLVGVNVNQISEKNPVKKEQLKAFLTENLRVDASLNNDFNLIMGAEPVEGAILDLAITEAHPGNHWRRVLAGELGMGHARVQIEGRLVDAESKETLMTFSDRRRSSVLVGLRDITGDKSDVLVEELIKSIEKDLVKELEKIL